MPENNDESCAKIRHPVFDSAQRIVIHQIPGGPDNEEISDTLIENNFRRGARIGATDYNGKWMLVLCRFCAPCRDRFAGAFLTIGESFVARFQSGEGVVRRNRSSRRIGRYCPASEYYR